MYLVEVSILREQYAIREQIYIIASVNSTYFYGSLMFYELCLLKSIWNVSFVTAVASLLHFFAFFTRFLCHVSHWGPTQRITPYSKGSFKHDQS